jgi:hypothetical protein
MMAVGCPRYRDEIVWWAKQVHDGVIVSGAVDHQPEWNGHTGESNYYGYAFDRRVT